MIYLFAAIIFLVWIGFAIHASIRHADQCDICRTYREEKDEATVIE